MSRNLVLAVLVTGALALAAVPAFAAKGGNGGGKGGGGKKSGSGSLALVVLDDAPEPAHRGRVTFEVSTTATDRPFVGLRCWQGSTFVYDAYVGYFDDYIFPDQQWFLLDSMPWAPGVEASCTARLFWYDSRGGQNVLATLDFPVVP